jgi:hypothetical protein
MMRRHLAQYLNEAVSLTMMALLIIALASGQAAGVRDASAAPLAIAATGSFIVRHNGE